MAGYGVNDSLDEPSGGYGANDIPDDGREVEGKPERGFLGAAAEFLSEPFKRQARIKEGMPDGETSTPTRIQADASELTPDPLARTRAADQYARTGAMPGRGDVLDQFKSQPLNDLLTPQGRAQIVSGDRDASRRLAGETSPIKYGERQDGTQKGRGYFGELLRPDGDISTELSIGVNLGGKETEIPLLVPTLDQKEIDYLLADGKPTKAIVDKAVEHAIGRMRAGKSPFADDQNNLQDTPRTVDFAGRTVTPGDNDRTIRELMRPQIEAGVPLDVARERVTAIMRQRESRIAMGEPADAVNEWASGLLSIPASTIRKSSFKFDADPADKYKKASAADKLGDVGLTAVKGAIGVPEVVVGLADIVTNGHVGKALESLGFRPEEAKAYLDANYSPEQQREFAEVGAAQGFIGKAAAAVKNPSTIAHAVLESLPAMGAGGLVGRALVNAGKASPVIAGALGEGVVGAGMAEEQIRQQSADGLTSPAQSLAAIASGAGTAMFGAAGGKIAQKLGIVDVDTMLAGGAGVEIRKGFFLRLVEGGISEGVFEEMPQSMQEQLWQNVATDKPLLDGVPEAGAMGLVTGAAMGGAGNVVFGNETDVQRDARLQIESTKQAENRATDAQRAAMAKLATLKPTAPTDPIDTATREIGDTIADAAIADFNAPEPGGLQPTPDATPAAELLDSDLLTGIRSDLAAREQAITGQQVTPLPVVPITPESAQPAQTLQPQQPATQVESAERYQWNANKEGGQAYGNQQVIQPLTKVLFDRFMADKTTKIGTFDAYNATYPGMSVSLISKDKGATWELGGVNTAEELRPNPSNPSWVKQVNSFDTPEAVQHGSMADSQLQEQQNAQAAPSAQPVQSPAAQAEAPVLEIVRSLQNRNRNSKASILQMDAIATNPNPRLLAASPTMETGAPVATDLASKGIATNIGNEDVITTGNREIPFRYAMVEADQLSPSNFANGSKNPEYATNTDKLTAINNGRTAGVIEAYNRGTAQNYRESLVANAEAYGFGADVVSGMTSPVLVRLMDAKHLTANIADESNTTSALGLSAVEQARNDARRVDISALTFNEDGTPSNDAMRGFIKAMPEGEWQNLAPNGIPTQQAADRVLGAALFQAYGSDELVGLAIQSTDQEARTIIGALSNAAPAMMKLEGAGDLDIRPIIVEAVTAVVNATRNGMSVKKLVQQRDMTHSDGVQVVLNMFAENIRSKKAITESLNNAAIYAASEAGHAAAGDMFGGAQATKQDVLRRIGNDATGQEDLGQQGGSVVAGQDVEGGTQNGPGQAGSQDAEKRAQAEVDLQDALSDLGAIFRKHAGAANFIPENTPGLMEVLVKLFTAATKLGHYRLKDAIKFVQGHLKSNAATKAFWDKISPETYAKAAQMAVDGDTGFSLGGQTNQEILDREQAQAAQENEQRAKETAASQSRADNELAAQRTNNVTSGAAADAFNMTPTEPVSKAKQNRLDKAKAQAELNAQADIFSQPAAEVDNQVDNNPEKQGEVVDNKSLGQDIATPQVNEPAPSLTKDASKESKQEPQSEVDKAKEAVAAIKSSDMTPGEKLATIAAVNKGDIAPEDVQDVVGKPVEAKAKIDDYGGTIAGNRKDRWKTRGMDASDLADMAAGEQAIYATKDNVWPKLDYAAMIESGVEPKAAALIKIIRDRMGAKPRLDTEQGRKDYVDTVAIARDLAKEVKTVAQAEMLDGEISKRLGLPANIGWDTRSTHKEQLEKLFSIYKGRKNPLTVKYADKRKADKMLADGWPAKKESGARQADDTKTEPVRPYLDKLERTGEDVRGGRNVTPEDFAKTFGMPKVNFGNYVANDEGQRHVNLAFEALYDLAQIMGVPPKAMSLNGTLNMAFGARGTKFAAHYEPGEIVINIAKVNGPGSLAHEFGHALDHYFGEIDRPDAYGGKARGATGWYKKVGADRSNLRPEVAEAFDGLMKALYERNKEKAEAVRQLEIDVENRQSDVARAEKNLARENLKDSERKEWKAWGEGAKIRLQFAQTRLAKMISEPDAKGKYGKAVSSYYNNAQKLSGKSGADGYWARPTEMFARAFESYIFDQIHADSRVSDYLVHGVEEDRFSGENYKGNPYPVGAEREAINAAMDSLVKILETKETDQGLALLSLSTAPNFRPLALGLAEATTARIGAVFSKKGWNVDLQLAPTFDALPNEVKAAVAEYGEDTKVKGVVHKGVAYVVADEHGSEADLEATILHEVTGHVGVRRLYGNEITNKLNSLYLAIGGRKGLSKIAAERGLTADLTEYAKMLGESEFSDEIRTRIMMEEVLTHIAEAPKFMDRVKSVIGAIRAWLRVNGFAKLAEYGETDLLNILSQGRAALATVQTDDGPAVLMVAYHGSPHDFEQFSLDKIGTGQFHGKKSILDIAGEYAARNELLDPPKEESAKVQLAIEGKTPQQAAKFIIATGNEFQKEVAQKVLVQLNRLMLAGVKLELKVAHVEDTVPGQLSLARGLTDWSFATRNNRITVWINGSDVTGKVGMSYETVLHELIHMATSGIIHLGQLPAAATYKSGKDVADLIAITRHIKKHFNQRVSDFEAGTSELTDFEARIHRSSNNALDSEDEILAWGLSNPEAQAYMESIPYPAHESAWSAFVSAIRRILGLSDKNATAFTELLRVSDNLMSNNVNEILGLDTSRGFNTVIQMPSGSGMLPHRQSQLSVSTNQPPAPPTRQTPLGLGGGASGNTQTWDTPISTGLDDIAYKLQNKNIDLKRVIESIKDAGRAIQDKFDPYLQEELFHKRAAKRTEDFVDRELNPLLRDAAMRSLTLDEIDQYLHARHAEEANALIAERNPDMPDGGSGMETADAKAYLSGLPAEKRNNLEAVAAKVDAILEKTRGLYASYGLESANTVQGWADMFQHYVPLMREDHDGGMGIGQGFSIKGREVKHRTGSTASVVDILANIAMQREKVIVRGEKNRVAVALAGLAKLNPNSEFWEVGKIPTEQVLNEKTGLVETRIDPMFKSRENAIVAKIADGKGGVQEIAVLFNEHNERAMRLAASMKNLDAAQLEGVLGVSAIITRYFASINTQYNPVFGVVNLVRDYQGAAMNLTSTPLAGHKAEVMNPLTVMSALKGIYLDTRAERKGGMAMSKWAQLWEEFNLEGGTTGYRDLFRTSEDRANKIESTLDPTKWMDSTLGQIFTAGGTLKVPMAYAQKKAGWLFDWLSDYNIAMENAMRLSAYKVALEQGMSKQRAASLAKNLTVNFNRKGQLGQQAGALYAFFNASMQGTARMAETLTTMDKGDIKTLRLSKNGTVIVSGGILLGVIQALMLAAAGFDDDEPPEFVRERNLIIPIGGKKYVTIPMPLGFHVLPNLGRIPTEVMLRGGKDAGERAIALIGTIIEAFNPTGSAGLSWQTVMPTPLDPAMALTENKDWTGKPIARQSFNHATPGHKLAKDTATHPARWISEAINYVTGGDQYTRGKISPTPDQIDYLGAQLGGGVLREVGKAEQAVSSMFTGEDLPPHKIPLAGRFYGNAEGSSSQGATFYKNIERLNEIEAEIKGRRQDGVPTDKYRLEHPEARFIALANQAEREVSKLRKAKRELVEKDAPRDRIKLIESRITMIMKKLNERVSEVRQ